MARKEKAVSPKEYKTGRKEKSCTDPEISVMEALKKWSMFSVITTKFSDRSSVNKANSTKSTQFLTQNLKESNVEWQETLDCEQESLLFVSAAMSVRDNQHKCETQAHPILKRKPYGSIPFVLHHKPAQSNSRRGLGEN